MKTKLYTYIEGKLIYDREYENVYTHPDIVIISYVDLDRSDIIKLLSLDKEIGIKATATYDYTLEGVADVPEYYTYRIFK